MGMRQLALAALLLLGCSSTPKPSPATPPDGDWCAAAEARLEKLDCRDPRGDPMWVNRRGERFADTCRTAYEQGGVFLNPQCIAEAASCQEANACPAQ
jgi:hypothetical protein